jgi:MerR family redox-sensitive transcriptional activator SoxR
MTIGELSARTGLPSSTIRYYEQQRLIPYAPRVSGRRAFDDRTVAQLSVVQLAREAGFALAEIRQLVNEFGRDRWRRLAESKLEEIRSTTERLRVMTAMLEKLLDCECPDIEVCGRVIRRRAIAGRSPARPGSRRRGARSSTGPS